MTFEASHKAKVYLSSDNTTFTQVDSTEASLKVSREVIDITTIGTEAWRKRLHGIKDWSVTLPNLWQSEGVVSNLLFENLLDATPLYIRIDVDGTSNNRFSGAVISEGTDMNFNLSDAQAQSQNLLGNGAMTAALAS